MKQEALSAAATDVRQAMRIIAEHMIDTRPSAQPVYRPFRRSDIWYEPQILSPRTVDLKKLYPHAKKGDAVYVGTVLDSVDEYDAKINMTGDAAIIMDGRVIWDYRDHPNERRRSSCPVHLKKGENPVLFLVRCGEDGEFDFSFMPSVHVFWFWASDYILHVRATSPIAEYAGEDGVGISALCREGTPFDGTYVYPPVEPVKEQIRFDGIFPQEEGDCAYAYTTALEAGTLTIEPFSPVKVLVNGKAVSQTRLTLGKGDRVLIKSRKAGQWGFAFSEDAKIGLPFLRSARSTGDRWLTLGTFGAGETMDTPLGPELEVQFTAPYMAQGEKPVFWKLAAERDYLRPYMDTSFYAQWFYALMVGQFGLLQAADVLENGEYRAYFVSGMQLMAKFYRLMLYEKQQFGKPAFLERAMDLGDLDSIGTMGMNLCEAYRIAPDPEVLACIEELAQAARDNIPRFPDGTYRRPRDMWSDDTFMSCPFLIRLGLLKNDSYYFEEVVRQLLGFRKRLWMEDEQVFSHIFFLNTQVPNRIPWGRGNGWVFVTLSDVLEKLPQNTAGREALLELFQSFAQGIARKQDGDGLWHQVLTRPDTYQETSCTGMFLLGFCRGLRNGWLGQEYRQVIDRAYAGLIDKKIDRFGNVYDVCRGSGNSMDVEYYANLGTIDNDDHGTGIILTALAELSRLNMEGSHG